MPKTSTTTSAGLRKRFSNCKVQWLFSVLSSTKKNEEILTFIFFQRMFCWACTLYSSPFFLISHTPGSSYINAFLLSAMSKWIGGVGNAWERYPVEFSLACFVRIQPLSSKFTVWIIKTKQTSWILHPLKAFAHTVNRHCSSLKHSKLNQSDTFNTKSLRSSSL